jgi:hypothetical protein
MREGGKDRRRYFLYSLSSSVTGAMTKLAPIYLLKKGGLQHKSQKSRPYKMVLGNRSKTTQNGIDRRKYETEIDGSERIQERKQRHRPGSKKCGDKMPHAETKGV